MDAPQQHERNRALSVHYLQTTFLEEIKSFGKDASCTVYQLEDLRRDSPGLMRSKGLHLTCPRDGREGRAYVDCVDGEDSVGKATHMLSYTWG